MNNDFQSTLQQATVGSNTGYPLAFLTDANCLFRKHRTAVSHDGTPRYVPNPNSPDNTYSLETCLKEYRPIYNKKELKQYER